MQEENIVLEELTPMNLFVPIDIEASLSKSDASNSNGDGGNWYVKGLASTPDLDFQGDIVQPEGIEIEYFKDHGWINYEHQQDAKSVIGVPTENCYIDFQKGLVVEAVLLKDNPYAQEMWALANSIKNNGVDRQLGFSIEGAIRKRNQNDTRIIESLIIKNVAITKNPANPHATWEVFMKSITTGHGVSPSTVSTGGALRIEMLGQAISNATSIYEEGNIKEYNETWNGVIEYLKSAGRFTHEAQTIVLQLARGISKAEAEEFLNKREEKE